MSFQPLLSEHTTGAHDLDCTLGRQRCSPEWDWAAVGCLVLEIPGVPHLCCQHGACIASFVSPSAWNRAAMQSILHTLPTHSPAAARWGGASCLASSAVPIRKPCPCILLNIPLRSIHSRPTRASAPSSPNSASSRSAGRASVKQIGCSQRPQCPLQRSGRPPQPARQSANLCAQPNEARGARGRAGRPPGPRGAGQKPAPGASTPRLAAVAVAA